MTRMAWSFVRTVIKYFAFQLKPHGKCSKLEQQEANIKMKSTERVSLTQFAQYMDGMKFGSLFKDMVLDERARYDKNPDGTLTELVVPKPTEDPNELFQTAGEWFEDFANSFEEDDFE